MKRSLIALALSPILFTLSPSVGEHRDIEIEGFTLKVHEKVLADKALWPKLEKEITSQLYQITRAVPKGALSKLQKISMWVNNRSKTLCMAYHPSKHWLEGHDFDPALAKCVELGNPKTFLAWTKQQPWMILHEYAHAFHHQVLGFDHKEVIASFARAKKSGDYDSVLRGNAKMVRPYALTDHKEFFAELSEALFGCNDFYPFVRAELIVHDKKMYELLRTLWQF